MLEQSFIKKNFVGQEGFQWWIGQIVNEEKWKANMPSSPQNNNESEDYKGFSERYKVRIMGYHTASKEELPDDDLPWATVMYPVTSGGGGRNSYGNANLTQGVFVFGFFMDGSNSQMPVIMGCLGYNDYQAVMKNVPEEAPFLPFSGYTENYDQGKVATIATRVTENPGIVARQVGLQTGEPVVDAWNEGVGSGSNNKDMASFVSVDEEEADPLPATSKCEPMPVGKLQRQLQNILQEVEKVRRAQTDYRFAVTKASGNEEARVAAMIKKAAKYVAGSMKYVYAQIEKSILKSISSGIQGIQNQLMPAEQHELKARVDGINDVVSCLFKRMIGGLYNMAFNFLNQMLTRAVNITRCFVDNFIGQILGKAMGTIDGIVQGALGGLNGMLALAGGLSGSIPSLNISTNVTALVGDILSFLTCEEDPECSDTKDFNILSGAGSLASTDVASILGTMGSVAAQAAADLAGQAAAGLGIPVPSASDLDSLGSSINFSSVSNASCSDGSNSGTDPRDCGPPLVSFLGGGLTGAPPVGNALISAAGAVLGVDLNSYGLNVSSNLQISINDDCGSGQGAVVTPVFGPVQTYQATETNINQPPPTNPDVWDQISSTGIGTISAWSSTTTYESGDIVQVPVGSTGTGAGTVAAASTDGFGPTTGLVAVNVVRGGTGYLPSPNGSTGGDGRTWARPDDTSIVRNSPDGESDGRDGLREIPRAPGNNMCVTAGDQVLLPPGTSVILEPSGEEILGGATRTVTTTGCFTTPPLPPDTTAPTRGSYPSGEGSYPVILSLDVVNINTPGVRYSPDDEVVITPSNGATAEIEVNDMGSITNVKITSSGEGFQEMPQVYVKSGTGFNADLNPRFRIDRVGDLAVEEPSVQDKIISVVDCVGKVPDSLYAPCTSCQDTSMVW